MTIITKGMGAVKQIYSKLAKTKTKSKPKTISSTPIMIVFKGRSLAWPRI